MKVRFTLSIGLVGKRTEIVEYDDNEFDGMTQEELHSFLDEEWKEWTYNYIDGGFEIQ
jgi:hypothetical protein